MSKHMPIPLKWSLFRQSRELLAAGACEYSIWLDGQIVIMADPAFGNIGAIETIVRLANEHDALTKALRLIADHGSAFEFSKNVAVNTLNELGIPLKEATP
jgi:hypothetical protein